MANQSFFNQMVSPPKSPYGPNGRIQMGEGYMGLNSSVEDMSDEEMNKRLAWLRKYDPKASASRQMMGNGLNEGGGPGQMGLTFNADWSKLPGAFGKDYGELGGMRQFGGETENNIKKSLANPNGMSYDPNYGWATTNKNTKLNFMEKYGPMIGPLMVGGFAGLMNGGLMGLLGASKSMALPNSILGVGKSLGSGNFNPSQLASIALGMVPGVPPGVAQAAKAVLPFILQQGRKP